MGFPFAETQVFKPANVSVKQASAHGVRYCVVGLIDAGFQRVRIFVD